MKGTIEQTELTWSRKVPDSKRFNHVYKVWLEGDDKEYKTRSDDIGKAEPGTEFDFVVKEDQREGYDIEYILTQVQKEFGGGSGGGGGKKDWIPSKRDTHYIAVSATLSANDVVCRLIEAGFFNLLGCDDPVYTDGKIARLSKIEKVDRVTEIINCHAHISKANHMLIEELARGESEDGVS